MERPEIASDRHCIDALVAWQIGRGQVASVALVLATLLTPVLRIEQADGGRESSSVLGVFSRAGEIGDAVRSEYVNRDSSPETFLLVGAVLLLTGAVLSVVAAARVRDRARWVTIVMVAAPLAVVLGALALWGGADTIPEGPVGVDSLEASPAWGLWLAPAAALWIAHLRLLVLMLRSPETPVRRFRTA